MRHGLYISPTEFVSFAEPDRASLSRDIATRGRSPDFSFLGTYLPNPDPVLKAQGRDIAIYKELRTDSHIGGLIRRRKGAVKQLERGLDRGRARSRIAAAVEDILARLPLQRIINSILDAPLFGYQPLEVLWQASGGQLLPVNVVAKPPEWFHFDPEGQLRFRSLDSGGLGELLPERKFLLPRQEPSYDNPYGVPDLSMVFWPVVFRKGGLKFWVNFTERYGTPWLIGKQPRNASAEETERLLNQLDAMIQDAVAAIPDDNSVDIIEAAGKTGSAEVYERLLMYCRSECNIALTGSNQSTEQDATHASARAGLQVASYLTANDAELVTQTLNQLIDWIVELNWGDAVRPVWSMWEQETVDTVLAARDKTLSDAGVKFTPQYWTRTYGLQEGDIATTPATTPPASPSTDFAEPDAEAGQAALDAALAALGDSDTSRQAWAAVLAPMREALAGARDFGEAAAALDAALPNLDGAALIEVLHRALFAAEIFGRQTAASEASADA